MPTDTLEIEGTWEEILARAGELRGKRLRVTVVPDTAPAYRPARGGSTGADLLKHAGSWVGDDLQECLDEVVRNGLPARF